MPCLINGRLYYRTAEVCREVGISRNTLYRWLKGSVLTEEHRDFRGWRVFTAEQIAEIRVRISSIKTISKDGKGR
jgi:DNA-binding transcriptional MerR regulator